MLPRRICKEISSLMARFWWGYKEKDNKIQWRSWDKLGDSKRDGGLGFRDLECFNQVMLAKQCWRMLNSPSLMVAKIMKEKYFRGADLNDAKLGNNPLYIWRSLWSAIELVKEGTLWRVGNGRKISIWHHKWLPCPSSYKVQSPQTSLPHDAKVSLLIDVGNGYWKRDLISESFNKMDAEQICKLPISRLDVEDKMVWEPTKNGRFSVKSAYFLGKERIRRKRGEGSGKDKVEEMWKQIWNLDVQGVVKLFLWKVGQELLPIKENLHRRKVSASNMCPICERRVETAVHMIWGCSAASDVWAMDESPVRKWCNAEWGFAELWASMFQKLRIEDVELMAYTMMRLWLRRNLLVFENKFDAPENVFKAAKLAMSEFKEANLIKQRCLGARAVRREAVKWEKPEVGMVKVNWDTAVDANNGRVGLGVVVRDDQGKF
ncbi:hypothetical protein CIPAW_14G039600 [Carya illinoinensis]|uniref:Reverse transcriptase zinc-binding domain-containing protein n=1 Tax=Carya illinoinensis TaxID=32201 RepID=A0A8T1NIT9_CARIL|nr:hypothetical protein CIPAW_14G039600 [Carya illinoinensis]